MKHCINVNLELSVETTESREEVLESVAQALDTMKNKGFAIAAVGDNSDEILIDSWEFDSIEDGEVK